MSKRYMQTRTWDYLRKGQEIGIRPQIRFRNRIEYKTTIRTVLIYYIKLNMTYGTLTMMMTYMTTRMTTTTTTRMMMMMMMMMTYMMTRMTTTTTMILIGYIKIKNKTKTHCPYLCQLSSVLTFYNNTL